MEAQKVYDSITKLITQKQKLNHDFLQEMRKLQTSSTDDAQEICNEHTKKLMVILESEKSLLLDLEKRLVLSDQESRKLEEVIKKKKEACSGLDHVVLERLKMEREDLSTRIIVLERCLDAKQALELEIQNLRGFLEVLKDVGGEDVVEALKKAMIMQLKGKEAELKRF